jgi:phage replication-related protein YjqB (UPF0714/DUF867 family)
MATHARICSRLNAAGIPADDLSVMDDLKTMITEKTMNRGEAASALYELWPEHQRRIIEDLHGSVNRLVDQARKLPEGEERRKIAERIKAIGAFQEEISRITREKFMAVFFPDLVEEGRQAAENQRSDLCCLFDHGSQAGLCRRDH